MAKSIGRWARRHLDEKCVLVISDKNKNKINGRDSLSSWPLLKESCVAFSRRKRFLGKMRRQVIVLAMTATAAQAWVPMPTFSGLTRSLGANDFSGVTIR